MEQLDLFSFPSYKISKNKKIRLIELFAGVGSQAMALRNIGVDFEHYRVVEFDKYAIASYNSIHHTNFEVQDITKINGDFLGITDCDKYEYIMTYSFPCTDLSIAGQMKGMKKGSGTSSGLLWEVERLLNETEELPQILIMENVPQVHSEQNIADFNNWIEFLKSKGYQSTWKDLKAKDYDVAQNRERCFMISVFSKDYVEYNFPSPQKLTKTVRDYLQENVEEKYFISKEKSDSLINQLLEKGVLPTQLKDNKMTIDKTRQDNGFSIVGSCQLLGKLDENGLLDIARRIYSVDGLCPCQTAYGCDTIPKFVVRCENMNEEPEYRIRKLTPNECWLLMGFNQEDFDNAKKVNSDTQLYKQAGNSIVVPVLEGLFTSLFE